MRRNIVVIAAAGVLLAGCASVSAPAMDFPSTESIEDLDDRATVIARGTVLDQREATYEPAPLEGASAEEAAEYAEAASFPITVYSFELSEVYQGAALAPPVMEVMQTGTPTEISELGQTLEAGSEYVLFLPDDPDDPRPVGIVGGPTGTFIVENDELISQAAAPSDQRSADPQYPVVSITWAELENLAEE